MASRFYMRFLENPNMNLSAKKRKKETASSFTNSHVVPTLYHFLASMNTKVVVWLNIQNALSLSLFYFIFFYNGDWES